jgi:hypothetical protein
MGAIARNIANNITTAGVFTSSALNSSSVTGITELANASDGITASNSASLSFTSGLTSTYKAYKFVFSLIRPRTDNQTFQFNLSTDSGSNYNVTKTSINFVSFHNETDTSTNLVTSDTLEQSTSYQTLTSAGGVGNGADEACSGSMTLFNPSSTTYVKHYIANTNHYHRSTSSFIINTFVGGYGNTTSAINAIRFQMTSGNFDGTIYLYGIK